MEKEIAKALLGIKAVFLSPDSPFTWASGIKSPIYCDNRLILTSPEARDLVEKSIAEKVKELYPEAQVLMGTSTAGIAHAAIAAHILGMPMGVSRQRVATVNSRKTANLLIEIKDSLTAKHSKRTASMTGNRYSRQKAVSMVNVNSRNRETSRSTVTENLLTATENRSTVTENPMNANRDRL